VNRPYQRRRQVAVERGDDRDVTLAPGDRIEGAHHLADHLAERHPRTLTDRYRTED
jgi:hypothetical protein